ncbi:hypothetical protein ACFQ0T_35835 [Kitasatospora gansuensis]
MSSSRSADGPVVGWSSTAAARYEYGTDTVLDEEVRVQLQAPAVQIDDPVGSTHRAAEHSVLPPAGTVVESAQHGTDPGLTGDVGALGDVGPQVALDVGPVLGEAGLEQGPGAVGEPPQLAGVAVAELDDDTRHGPPGAVPGECLPQLGRGGGQEGVEFVGELSAGARHMGHQEVRDAGAACADHVQQRRDGVRYPAAHPDPPAGAPGARPGVGSGQGGQDVAHR